MTRYLKRIIGFVFAVLFAAPMLAGAQGLPPIFPGVTTLGERIVPSPFGVSPQMTEIVGERRIPPDIPVAMGEVEDAKRAMQQALAINKELTATWFMRKECWRDLNKRNQIKASLIEAGLPR